MINVKEANYTEMREKIRKELFAEIEKELPKSTWRRLAEAAELTTCGLEPPIWDFFSILCVIGATLIFALAETKWYGFIFLIPAWIILIKKALEIHATMKNFKEVENILPEWKMAPYDRCVQLAEEYRDHDGAYYSVPYFLYSHIYLQKMEQIASMQILDVTFNAAGNCITITYSDKAGNVMKYSTNCEVRKNTSITETEIEVTVDRLICTVPYKADKQAEMAE